MQFWELTVSALLKKDLARRDMNEQMSRVINKALLMDDRLKEFHKVNTFKFYVFSNLYPLSRDGYKKGNMYFFKVRCLDRTFALKLKSILKVVPNALFQIVSVDIESKPQAPISTLYTATPAIAVFTPEGSRPMHWTNLNFTLNQLKERMNVNAKKKYELWTDEKVNTEPDFIETIEQTNSRAIILNYKSPGKLLTNKFKIQVKQDNLSQNLAFMVLATGLLEKNALGLGYCTSIKQRG